MVLCNTLHEAWLRDAAGGRQWQAKNVLLASSSWDEAQQLEW
jgi:hypothetical protein